MILVLIIMMFLRNLKKLLLLKKSLIELYKTKKIKLLFEPLNNDKWNDIFYSSNNNLKNFKYKNLNQIVFKSKKLTKNYPNKYLLYDNKNLIFGDDNGNLIVFSIYQDKIISKYNFYKNKFKKIKKIKFYR